MERPTLQMNGKYKLTTNFPITYLPTITTITTTPSPSRLLQLLFPKKLQESQTNHNLKQQPRPPPYRLQPFATEQHEIGKHRPRTIFVRCRRSPHHRTHTPKHLRRYKCKRHMEPRQRLEQDHPEPDALNRVQHSEPKPQHPARESSRNGTAGPRDPSTHPGGCPEDLAPARAAEPDGGDGDDPAVVDGEASENEQDEGPDEDEEAEDEEDDAIGGGVLGRPEELPIAAEGGGEEVVLEDHGHEEPLMMGKEG